MPQLSPWKKTKIKQVQIKQTSHRVTQPSNTVFNVPYTNNFTVITENNPHVAKQDIKDPQGARQDIETLQAAQSPSYTYFDVLYTNEFTDIVGEQEPLVVKVNAVEDTELETNYGSVSD